ncbi:peptide-N(4)-(N-acetyl-beta-glucosaminyl)asparagine amidase [Odontomachus brunneus]|uniref:peptide-N(4)-(N-acetyl-beta- glucosaminyl)asparagine amidase n=1 Tax=Odontomachus brunneus TaxID=486640 RepID=UPI0013F1F273|nr:peptide-N(4)-(N-acetyl-beta-glucosaminyl)asparagine amidase [Odontomachus brunneus]XP_032670204.1 peptide-N(4)-(N-acetyl-beta-glucosaminyl)asparagine amidase [Odontomachus brunneus]XP_032670212.1 peptide-N(4)-(N-acetyl-beta-glucosaminyl)asparagine amidase [Odontomachus brunneus]
MDDNLKYWLKCLEENEYDVCDEAQVALLNICHNLLKSPDNEKFREVHLDNEIIVQKILPAIGALECLVEVGYVEDGERLIFPHNTPLSKIKCLSQMLSTRLQKSVAKSKEPVHKNTFFKKIVQYFDSVMLYENEELQKQAIKLIPVDSLEIKSVRTFRELQRYNKVDDSATSTIVDIENNLSLQDFFLVAFTSWFKQDFFKWVDSPMCPICSIKCVYKNTVELDTPSTPYSRVELYRCTSCRKIVEFPRYSHPKPLLSTRCGRCGEWANVYTLMCRSLKYDARLVHDETDHAWTEVWSSTQKKWIHVDPCENVVNKPLMYEKGWNKKLTYIIAYSKDEVQDVTWRYTQNPEAVLKRRTACTEQNLITLIRFLSNKRQSVVSYSAARRKYIIDRTLCELASMIYVPNSQNEDSDETYQERTSGSLTWRLARGESTFVNKDQLNKNIEKNYIWDISKYGQTFELRYNIVKDLYQVVHNDGTPLEQINEWSEGINSTCGGVFRKEEDDWKIVYLARSQGAKHGRVTWTFKIMNPQLCVQTFNLKAKSEVFHGASVSWEIEAIFNDNKTIVIPIEHCSSFHTKEVEKAMRLNLSATLSGGKNDIAWQHAQIFRQAIEDTEEPSMIITIQLKNQCV